MTDRKRRLEAPHRRLQSGSSTFERVVVVGYKAIAWLIGHLPPAVPRVILARGAQLSYLLWPTKRRWSNANFGHVLGLPPEHPSVRRTALAAYALYGRYVVELARLPALAREHADELVTDVDLDQVHELWEASPGGLIFSLGHIGNAEAAAAGVASRGWPINVVADDSSFPGLFEEFSRTREQWGVHIIPWRNLRELYTVLKRREMVALLIDWGYREDGIPVRLFDAWTTLPAGPATLAAKTRSQILPVTINRNPDGRTFSIGVGEVIEVASTDPAELQRATQLMADAFAASIAVAPEQWYSFKPVWPADPAESAALEARAREIRGIGTDEVAPDESPSGSQAGASDSPVAAPVEPTSWQRVGARVIPVLAKLLVILPEGPVNVLGGVAGACWYRLAPERAARARRNLRRVAEHLQFRGLGGSIIRAAATDDRALERVVRSAFGHAVRYYLDMARLPGRSSEDLERRLVVETPDAVADAFGSPGPMVFVSMHFGAVEYPALFAVARTGRNVTAPMETLADPALQAWIERTRSSVGVDIVGLRDARRALTQALDEGGVVGMVADRNVAGGTIEVPFFGAPAPLPMGPGLLALERGLPIWVAAVRRAHGGSYRGQLRRVDIPAGGQRRARLRAAMTGVAQAMEESIAEAPEQWWSVFSPIWPDLDPEARAGTGRLESRSDP